MWDGQVIMSGLEACSSLHASLGTGMAHDRYSWGHKSGLSTHTGGGWREEGSGFMWTLFTEEVFLSNTGRLKWNCSIYERTRHCSAHSGALPLYFPMALSSHRLFLTAVITEVCKPCCFSVIIALFRALGKLKKNSTCPSRAGEMGTWSGRKVERWISSLSDGCRCGCVLCAEQKGAHSSWVTVTPSSPSAGTTCL